MSNVNGSNSSVSFFESLVATARARADQPALFHKYRGLWGFRRWRDVVTEIDRLAAGLRSLGLAADHVVAVDGEVTARLFLTAAAIRSVGARIRAVPISASVQELDRVLQDPGVTLVLAQGRETVAEWSVAAINQRHVPIIFDHATPESRSPDPGIVTLDTLRGLAAPKGWADGLPISAVGKSDEVGWAEETTDWLDGVDTLLGAWVSSGSPLALPELLAAATRDRVEAAPTRWIASIDRIETVAGTISAGLPDHGSWTGRLVAGALRGSRTPWALGLVGLVRNRIGVGRLQGIDVYGPPGREPATDVVELFRQLGIALRFSGRPDLRSFPTDAAWRGNLATGGAVS